MNFKDKVYGIVAAIPAGTTLTYKEVAELAGNAKAARAVGSILKQNYDPAIPCHRVIRSDGQAGGYNRGAERKAELLLGERPTTPFQPPNALFRHKKLCGLSR